jgi:dTMP kinase
MERGRYLVFEGIDGCGKSTQAARVARILGGLLTFEMGATKLGAALRDLILTSDHTPSPLAEALLIAADRAEHMTEVVVPALDEGRTVVSDRNGASTIAYQGYGRGLDQTLLKRLVAIATQGITPDLTVLLDIDPLRALQRRSGEADRMEREAHDFFERVREGYRAQAVENPETWFIVDATLPLEQVSRLIDEHLRERGLL